MSPAATGSGASLFVSATSARGPRLVGSRDRVARRDPDQSSTERNRHGVADLSALCRVDVHDELHRRRRRRERGDVSERARHGLTDCGASGGQRPDGDTRGQRVDDLDAGRGRRTEVVDGDRVRQRAARDHRVRAVLLADDEVGDVTWRGRGARCREQHRHQRHRDEERQYEGRQHEGRQREWRGNEEEREPWGPRGPAGLAAVALPSRHCARMVRRSRPVRTGSTGATIPGHRLLMCNP